MIHSGDDWGWQGLGRVIASSKNLLGGFEFYLTTGRIGVLLVDFPSWRCDEFGKTRSMFNEPISKPGIGCYVT
ncbi:MAG: hypothetical protein KBT63_08090 [Porticoccaceae bacterium]|nr:hypothetical protein [Porticoccaceae bacterium]